MKKPFNFGCSRSHWLTFLQSRTIFVTASSVQPTPCALVTGWVPSFCNITQANDMPQNFGFHRETGFIQLLSRTFQGLFLIFQGLKITDVGSAMFSWIYICPIYTKQMSQLKKNNMLHRDCRRWATHHNLEFWKQGRRNCQITFRYVLYFVFFTLK